MDLLGCSKAGIFTTTILLLSRCNHRHSILRNWDWNPNKFRMTTIVDTSGVNMVS